MTSNHHALYDLGYTRTTMAVSYTHLDVYKRQEVEHAEEEGIIFKTLCNPVEIHPDENGFVKSITCVEMELGEPDASGPVSYTHLRPAQMGGLTHGRTPYRA